MKLRLFLILVCFFMIASTTFAQTDETAKVDEFETPTCEDYLSRMDGVQNFLRNNPSSNVYILVYEGKELRLNNRTGEYELAFPNFGSAKAKIRSMKKRLQIIDRIVFVEAGFRQKLTIEIWAVPLGKMPPNPSPTLKKIRYRKGKPEGFCLSCCG
jgi:hypothetical protein